MVDWYKLKERFEINEKITENIYLVNDYPGLAVMGFFEPGSQVGDTRLNLNVRGEERYYATIRIDNHGTDETGRQRLYGEVLVNNLLGAADQLHVGALRAFAPSNTTYWLLRYSFTLSPIQLIDKSDTQDNITEKCYGGRSICQTFEGDGDAHSFIQLDIYLFFTGTLVNDLNINVYNVDANHKPTGASLGNTTVDKGDVFEAAIHNLTVEASILASTEYAIVLTTSDGDSDNCYIWPNETGIT